MSRSRVPAGKKVLNVHVSTVEHDHLRARADAEGIAMTAILRRLIRRDMRRAARRRVGLMRAKQFWHRGERPA